ncbi:MAG: S-layer homology domain-containing protein [Oscillospiraceae bacterium]|nr:S-layer homology domain-containing protein [Oscillospiraceae bacterium]
MRTKKYYSRVAAAAIAAVLFLVPQTLVLAEGENKKAVDEERHTPGYLTDEARLPGMLPIVNADVAYLTIRRTGDSGIPVTISNREKIGAVCEFINNAEYYVCSPEFRKQSGGAGGWSYWLRMYGDQDDVLFSYSGGAWPFYDGTDYYDLLRTERKALDDLLSELYAGGDDLETDEPAPDAQYGDVPSGAWYSGAADFVTTRGLMAGTGDNKFSPDAQMTRGMLITVLARIQGVDVSGGCTWYGRAAQWGMERGITDGTDMEGGVTREQFAAMMYRFAWMQGKNTSKTAGIVAYPDIGDVSKWAREAVEWAIAGGLMQGRTAAALAPHAIATRAEAAAMLQRYLS